MYDKLAPAKPDKQLVIYTYNVVVVSNENVGVSWAPYLSMLKYYNKNKLAHDETYKKLLEIFKKLLGESTTEILSSRG